MGKLTSIAAMASEWLHGLSLPGSRRGPGELQLAAEIKEALSCSYGVDASVEAYFITFPGEVSLMVTPTDDQWREWEAPSLGDMVAEAMGSQGYVPDDQPVVLKGADGKAVLGYRFGESYRGM